MLDFLVNVLVAAISLANVVHSLEEGLEFCSRVGVALNDANVSLKPLVSDITICVHLCVHHDLAALLICTSFNPCILRVGRAQLGSGSGSGSG